MTLPLLRDLAKKNKIPEVYVIEEMAANCEKDVKILWLPVAHCELNPIELIWSQLKRKFVRLNFILIFIILFLVQN